MAKIPRQTVRARGLRRSSTDPERSLWQRLRAGQLNGHKFRRQHSIGPYIVDFVCVSRQLIVELDGGQHAEDAAADAVRTRFLGSHGFRVLRFWNHEVLENPEGVLAAILQALRDDAPAQASPSPGPALPVRPLPGGER